MTEHVFNVGDRVRLIENYCGLPEGLEGVIEMLPGNGWVTYAIRFEKDYGRNRMFGKRLEPTGGPW